MSEDPKTRAETLKAEGNAALQHFKFATAIELYTAAIELFPTAIYYANRAAAHMRTESYGLAIEDASSAIATDPNYIKGANTRVMVQRCLTGWLAGRSGACLLQADQVA